MTEVASRVWFDPARLRRLHDAMAGRVAHGELPRLIDERNWCRALFAVVA